MLLLISTGNALIDSLLLLSLCNGLYRRGRAYYNKRTATHKKIAEAAATTAAAVGELSMTAKRSRFPGTPSIALAKGRGVIAVSDVLVTWVSNKTTGSPVAPPVALHLP